LKQRYKIIYIILKHNLSKQELVVCFIVLYEDLSMIIRGTRKFSNNQSGFTELIKWVENKKESSLSLHFTLEPTGIYHENFVYFLSSMNYQVHVVLTKKAKRYAESLAPNSKTDKLDSKALGRLGVERNLDVWRPDFPIYRKLKILTRERSAILKLRTMVNNQLEAMENSAHPNKKSINRHKYLIKEFSEQIKKIENDIENTVNGDVLLKEKLKKIITIPGVGFLTAITIIAETDGFALIKSIKQITAYAGLDVKVRESGKWKGKSKISKTGNVHIRKALYWPAYSSIKYSNTYSTFYERIRQRKEKSMIAAVAVQRKILGLIFTLWKNDSVYIENYKTTQAA